MTWRQMIAVGVRRVVLARGELDKLEGPKYAASRAELRRKAREEARARDRQAAAASQDEADENDATEEEATGGRTTRVGRPRGGMKVAARIGEGLRREIRKRQTPKGGRRLAHHTPLLKIPVWWRRAVLPSLPWVVRFLSFLFRPLLPVHTAVGAALPANWRRAPLQSRNRARSLLSGPTSHEAWIACLAACEEMDKVGGD